MSCMYTERIDLTIIVDDDHDTDNIVPEIEKVGVIDCKNIHGVGIIVGHIATSEDNVGEIIERLRTISGVSWVGSSPTFETREP